MSLPEGTPHLRALPLRGRAMAERLQRVGGVAVARGLPPWLRTLLASEWREKIEKRLGLKVGRLLGCGVMGCVFATDHLGKVLKVTADPSEGQVWERVRDEQNDDPTYEHGIAVVYDMTRPAVRVKSYAGAKSMVYAVLREDCEPLFDMPMRLFLQFGKRSDKTKQVPMIVPPITYHDLNGIARALDRLRTGAFIYYDERKRRKKKSAFQILNMLIGGRGSDDAEEIVRRNHLTSSLEALYWLANMVLLGLEDYAPTLAATMRRWNDRGEPLRDVHAGNVGVRQRTEPMTGAGHAGEIVIYDPGFTPITEMSGSPADRLANPWGLEAMP